MKKLLAFLLAARTLLTACSTANSPSSSDHDNSNNSGDVNNEFKSSYIASLRRLCDHNYAERLKSHGFSVPSIYLDDNCQLLSEIRQWRNKGENADMELKALYDKIKNNPSILR